MGSHRGTPEERVLPALLALWAERSPERVFIQEVDGPRLTYADAYRESLRWARAFAASGVQHGTPLVTMLHNGVVAASAAFGIQWIRGLEFPLNPAYRGGMLADLIAYAEAEVLIVASDLRAHFQGIEGMLERLRLVIVVDGPTDAWSDFPCAVLTVAEFLSRDPGSPSEMAAPEWHDIALIHLTSGTTGPSKGVMQYWRQAYKTATSIVPYELAGLNASDRWYSPYSMASVAGRCRIYTMATVGGGVVMRPSFRTQDFWPDVRRYGCTHTLLVRTTAKFVMSQPPSPDDRDHPLKSVQMAPLIGELDEFRERFGVPVYTVYNMTELSTPIVSPGTDLVDGTSCGQMREGYDCRVFDAHDREVPHGEVGELVVRAREPFALMAGYWRRPEATAECFRNLWLHTGDLFRRDEAGNFYYCDRLKDAIRYRGQNVSSSELEREVNSHPAIVESAAIGVPSDVNDEDIKVVVQLAAGATLQPEELIAFLSERVPRFMLPRFVEIVAELPRSSSEKIQKSDLRKDALNARTWDRTALASRV